MTVALTEAVPEPLAARVAEPFRSDPEFWRSVCASADAVCLLGAAVLAALVLRLLGAGVLVALLPFAVPLGFLVSAARASGRFHRAHGPLPATVSTPEGELSWRDAERTAVAAVFVRALVRNRTSSPVG